MTKPDAPMTADADDAGPDSTVLPVDGTLAGWGRIPVPGREILAERSA